MNNRYCLPTLWLALAACLVGAPASAQPFSLASRYYASTSAVVDANLSTTYDSGTDRYAVDVRFQGNPADVNTGSFTVILNYDGTMMEMAGTPAAGTDYAFNGFNGSCYMASDVFSTGTEVTIDVAYNYSCSAGSGTAAPATGPLSVVTLYFDALPGSRGHMPGIQFDAATEILDDDSGADVTGTTTGQNASLPVELVAFEALVDGDGVVLRWSTASETNNAGFEILSTTSERTDWRAHGFAPGAGTTLEPRDYTYRVAGMAPGTHRFRLRQVDFDGSFEFSPEVEVMVEVPVRYELSAAYPNPFNPQTQVTLALSAEEHVRVTVYDVLGREVARLHEGTLAAQRQHTLRFVAAHLPSGLYLIRVQGQTFADVRRVTLLK